MTLDSSLPAFEYAPARGAQVQVADKAYTTRMIRDPRHSVARAGGPIPSQYGAA